MRDGIIAAISFGVGWVAKENAGDRARCKLMRRGSGDARVAETAEDAKLIIRGWCTEEKMVRGKIATSATRANVKKK